MSTPGMRMPRERHRILREIQGPQSVQDADRAEQTARAQTLDAALAGDGPRFLVTGSAGCNPVGAAGNKEL